MPEAAHFEDEQGGSRQPGRKSVPTMRIHSPHREDGVPLDRTDPQYAFVMNDEGDRNDHTANINRAFAESLINDEEHFLHECRGDIIDHLRTKMHFIVASPHRHEANIERHGQYLRDLGMRQEHAVFASAPPGDDESDDKLRQLGFANVWKQQEIFDEVFDESDRKALWDILQLPAHLRNDQYVGGALRKQGTLLAMALGSLKLKPDPETPFLCTDTDIINIGKESRLNLEQVLGTSYSHDHNFADNPVFEEYRRGINLPNYDPVSYMLAGLDIEQQAATIQIAKKDRNNFPMHLIADVSSELGKWGEAYAEGASDLWLLTGEFGERYKYLLRQIWGTQYAVETMKRLWQIHSAHSDPSFIRKQIAVNRHIPRRDGRNTTGKEFPMYADAARLLVATLKRAENVDRGFHEFTLDDIEAVNNARMRKQGVHTFTDYDADDYPGVEPKSKISMVPSVLFPSIQQLCEAGIGRFPEHVKDYFKR